MESSRTIKNKILEVMKKHGLKPEENRVRRLLENIQEIANGMSDELIELLVVDNLTIGESYFFRDRKTFEKLKLIMQKKSEWSILSIGCSRGEEVYTIAIISKELGVKSKILGIDVNYQRIEEAKSGCYRFWSLRFLSDEEIDRYFIKNREKYCIKEEFKENVSFQQCNINSCTALNKSKFDIIFIRRVLLYTDNIERIIDKLNNLLKDDGILVLGIGEYFPEIYNHFEPVYEDISCILKKIDKQVVQKFPTKNLPKQSSIAKKGIETSLTSYPEKYVDARNKKHVPFVIPKNFEEEIKLLESLMENKLYSQAYEKAKELSVRYPTEYLVWKYRTLLEAELSMKDEAKKSVKKAIFLNHHDDEIWQLKHFLERFER